MMVNPTPPTIAIDASNINAGGGLTHLCNLLECFAPEPESQPKLTIFANPTVASKLPQREYIEIIQPPELSRSWIPRRFWQLFKLPRALRTHKCDILFTPGGSAARIKIPVVTMSQNMLPFEWRQLFQYRFSWMTLRLILLRLTLSRTFRRAAGLIFLTDYAKSAILKTIGSIQGESAIIPHGIRRDFFHPPKLQRPIASYRHNEPYQLLYVSIVDTYKHQIQVLEAVANLRAQGMPLNITFVGGSYTPSVVKFRKALRQLDPEKNFAFYHGPVPHKDLAKYYQDADLGIFASSCENLPIILLEMMAASLPVVCSKMGPMPEVLQDGGLYFDPYNGADMEQAIAAAIAAPELRWQMALTNRRRALNYSWEKCAADTFGFITSCITMPSEQVDALLAPDAQPQSMAHTAPPSIATSQAKDLSPESEVNVAPASKQSTPAEKSLSAEVEE